MELEFKKELIQKLAKVMISCMILSKIDVEVSASWPPDDVPRSCSAERGVT